MKRVYILFKGPNPSDYPLATVGEVVTYGGSPVVLYERDGGIRADRDPSRWAATPAAAVRRFTRELAGRLLKGFPAEEPQ